MGIKPCLNTRRAAILIGVIAREIAYCWNQEVTAMGKLITNELEVVYKTGMKPSEYLAISTLRHS